MISTYVVTHDYGFAPNPDGDFLSLACCKPRIRLHAAVGDWIVGTCPTDVDAQRISFAAKVSEIVSFDTYFRRCAGRRDAIYRREADGSIAQAANSYHGPDDIQRDTSVDRVLICERFWYFGDKAVRLPDNLTGTLLKRGAGHRNCDDPATRRELEAFLAEYPVGRLGAPRSKVRMKVRAPS